MKTPSAALVFALVLGGALGTTPARAARINVPRPPVAHIVYSVKACDGADGCADPDTQTIYIDPHGGGPFGRQHELGHLFDAEVLTNADRRVLMRRMGVRGPWVHWDPVPGTTYTMERTGAACVQPGDCPNELFADAYATCRLHLIPGIGGTGWQEGYGWDPTKRQERRFCQTVARIGWRFYRSGAVPSSNSTRAMTA